MMRNSDVLPTPLSPSKCKACPVCKEKLNGVNKGLWPRTQEILEIVSMAF
jgi:hypothetical protein